MCQERTGRKRPDCGLRKYDASQLPLMKLALVASIAISLLLSALAASFGGSGILSVYLDTLSYFDASNAIHWYWMMILFAPIGFLLIFIARRISGWFTVH